MPAIDVLDDQQIYHTDKMYLKDNQKTQKEREAFDWTGRENLQLGFGSQKLAWKITEPEIIDVEQWPEWRQEHPDEGAMYIHNSAKYGWCVVEYFPGEGEG